MNTHFRWLAALTILLFASVAANAQYGESHGGSEPTPFNTDLGKDKVIGLDYFFNHQVKNGEQFHYIWEDTKNSGYSKFGDVWKQSGASLAKVDHAPTADDLSHLSVYIIVNPSTEKNAADNKPNYIDPASIDAIANWVKAGGVLAIFANDKNNCEFDHLNQLTTRFGIKYNADLRNTVPTHQYKDMLRGTFSDLPDVPLFNGVKLVYMKEISTITVNDPAQPLLIADKQDGAEGKDIIIATAHYGNGFVFAVGDPWFYNEYIDVKTPELAIQNRKAAENFVAWTLGMAAKPTAPQPATAQ
jgi:unsaturated rhamnogalacturonyl hydrolase